MSPKEVHLTSLQIVLHQVWSNYRKVWFSRKTRKTIAFMQILRKESISYLFCMSMAWLGIQSGHGVSWMLSSQYLQDELEPGDIPNTCLVCWRIVPRVTHLIAHRQLECSICPWQCAYLVLYNQYRITMACPVFWPIEPVRRTTMCSSKYCHDSAYPNNVPPIHPSTTVGSDMSELQLVWCWAIDESSGQDRKSVV